MQPTGQRLKLGACFLGRKRPGFDPEWGQSIEQAAREHLAACEFEVVFPTVKIADEATLGQGVGECAAADVHAILIVQPTMSDGNLSAALARLWDGPVVLWATPEKPEGAMISSCSLVGAHAFASTLRQLHVPFELAYGMPGDPDTDRQLSEAVRLAAAPRRLCRAKVGLVGYHAPGFIDMHSDPFELKTQLGPQLRHFGLHELIDAMGDHTDAKAADDAAVVAGMGLPLDGVTPDDLLVASRYYLSLKRLIDEVRLMTEGHLLASEGDVDGAVTALVGRLLGMGPAFLCDWLEHTRDTITLWHAGDAPLELCEPIGAEHGPTIGRHFNSGKPSVVNAALEVDQPVTLCRLWRCDNTRHMMALEAQTIEPARYLLGTGGLVRVSGLDVPEYFDAICHAGMPHHVAVFAGAHANLLRRFARRMGVRWLAA
jgi:L-fucose isomerase-like protein